MYLVKEGRAATTKQANISYLLRIRLARGITFDTAYRKCIMHDKYSDEIGYFFSIQIRANLTRNEKYLVVYLETHFINFTSVEFPENILIY